MQIPTNLLAWGRHGGYKWRTNVWHLQRILFSILCATRGTSGECLMYQGLRRTHIGDLAPALQLPVIRLYQMEEDNHKTGAQVEMESRLR